MDGWNSNFLFGFRPIFRGYVSFREGIPFLHPTPLRLRTLSNSSTSLQDAKCLIGIWHVIIQYFTSWLAWPNGRELSNYWKHFVPWTLWVSQPREFHPKWCFSKGISGRTRAIIINLEGSMSHPWFIHLLVWFLGGGFIHSFCHFHPENCGRWIQFDEHIFQMGGEKSPTR